MDGIKSIYELLGRFIPFCISLVWLLMLVVSPWDGRTRQKQKLRWLSVIFFALFALICLFPMLCAYFTSLYVLFDMLMFAVLIWIPVVGYRLVWHMTDTNNIGDFQWIKHYSLPLIYVLFLISAEVFLGESYIKELLNLTVVSVFVLSYLWLSLIRIRKHRRMLKNEMEETTKTKQWYQFVSKVVVVTTLLPIVVLFPQTTPPLFVIYLILMFGFIFISSQLCYCSVFLQYAHFEPQQETDIEQQIEPVSETPKRTNRRIANVSRNANGRLEMEPLTRRRFEAYIRKNRPYLDARLKMTDMEETLQANRNVISNFVNRTYKMNFNCYINHLRIKEVERLQKLPSSEKYTMTQLVRKAGFYSMRNYNRAIEIEKSAKQNTDQ